MSDSPEGVARTQFRNAMSRVGAAVHIITTRDEVGPHGLTASAVCSVTDTPPTLLFCLNRTTSSHGAFKIGGCVCVNTLSAGQTKLSAVFADRTKLGTRFSYGRWTALSSGAPVLEGAAASFDARIIDMIDVGTHSVIFVRIEAVVSQNSLPVLIYLGRAYHELPGLNDIAEP